MITSPANPTVKELVRLRNRRERDDSGRFVIEGRRPLSLAVAAGVHLLHQVICPQLGGRPIPGVPVVEMAEVPFRKASIRQNPEGVLAVASHLDTSLSRLVLSPRPLVLVVESIEKPGNLGAMLRTCDAFGVEALVVSDPTTDVHNPNVVRASQGALFTVPVAVAPAREVRDWLHQQRVRLVATTPSARHSPWEVDLGDGVAVVVGAEDRGLTNEMMEAADAALRIPMTGRVDSLNASVAAAVSIYEVIRQRGQG